jgi:predicted nucleic acid-binding protein
VHYLDTSAIAKLAVAEPESQALAAALEGARARVTSRVGFVEFRRLAHRSRVSATRTAAVLNALVAVELDEQVERIATTLDVRLRTLDAVHLASALALGDELTSFVCYDARLSDAARAAGLAVIAPS